MFYTYIFYFIIYNLLLDNLPEGAPMVNELGGAGMASYLDVLFSHLMANPRANNLGEALVAANPMGNNLPDVFFSYFYGAPMADNSGVFLCRLYGAVMSDNLDAFFPTYKELPWPTVLGKTLLL